MSKKKTKEDREHDRIKKLRELIKIYKNEGEDEKVFKKIYRLSAPERKAARGGKRHE